jgi:transcriptional regulator of arginine metabolism
MRHKRERQAALLKLVRERTLTSQDEMVRLLRERGVGATQTSISRDVRELALVRVDGRYVRATRLGGAQAAADAASFWNGLITFVEPVGANLIVIRTPIGSANAAAVALDQRNLPGVVGTVAGDDTIFVAVRSRSVQGRVLAELRAGLRLGAGTNGD